MLRLDNIVKDYPMKDSVVHALKGISLCFRTNEFVSVLGPSGCGKTTLLNILGGLDHYTSGDLIIDGRSTKDFKDHDWDIYRNHRIGFIFQSYNLIPHENILENVELALTIGGIGKEERTKRSMEALDKVGLKGLYKKMPNQLSGGQCQRVAIARALVNEPEILLADEPTGALDSVTSVQIMDLIKEISKEKLVIMVTHNPDLAYRYSTRIVKLLDGELISDSNPYTPEEEAEERNPNKRKKASEDEAAAVKNEIENGSYGESSGLIRATKDSLAQYTVSEEEADKQQEEPKKEKASKKPKKEKASMSWWTAFRLSAKNLWSKVGRTLLIIFAASIGITGVSAVMSVSNGVTEYIDSSEDEMLSGNPVVVASESFDLSSITDQMTAGEQADAIKDAAPDGYINVDYMTERLINSAKEMGLSMIENNITQDYVDYIDAMPSEYYQDVVKRYGIDITNNVYTDDDIDDSGHDTFSLAAITQIASAVLSQKLSETGYSAYASTIASYTGTFSQSINNTDYLLSQYDIVEGKMATEADEIMIVLNSDEEITDFMLTLLGYFSEDQFLNIVYKYNTDENGNPDSRYDEEEYEKTKTIALETLMSKRFTYYPNDTIYTKNENYDPNASGSDLLIPAKVRPFYYSYYEDDTWSTGVDLKVVGVLTPKEGRQYTTLSTGFYYTPAFAEKYLSDNYDSEVSTFIRDYVATQEENGNSITGYTSYITSMGGVQVPSGIYYTFDYSLEGTMHTDNIALVGSSNSLSSLLAMYAASSGSSGNPITTSTLTTRAVGGNKLPSSIRFYPNTFDTKNLVTDYLSAWNSDEDLVVNGKTLKAEDRDEINYTDNLQVVINIVNNIITIVTIALMCFTSLSLIVSVVMIAVITYVSVMERIKEIGIIRALGGRKRDVSHLFNAENFIIGFFAGVWGILIAYLIDLILNLVVHSHYEAISAIGVLPIQMALLVLLGTIFLTWLAGFIPSRSAAKKDPVVALRTE